MGRWGDGEMGDGERPAPNPIPPSPQHPIFNFGAGRTGGCGYATCSGVGVEPRAAPVREVTRRWRTMSQPVLEPARTPVLERRTDSPRPPPVSLGMTFAAILLGIVAAVLVLALCLYFGMGNGSPVAMAGIPFLVLALLKWRR